MKRRVCINGILVFIFTVVMLFLSKFTIARWSSSILDQLLDFVGLCILVLGQIIRIYARGYKAHLSSRGDVLVTGGPYAYVRNPMYLGSFFIGIGVIIMLCQWYIILIFLLVYSVMFFPKIVKEEKLLARRFGVYYIQYFNSVPRFFPSLSKKPFLYRPLLFRWNWIKSEMPTILTTFTAVFLIETYEDINFMAIPRYYMNVPLQQVYL